MFTTPNLSLKVWNHITDPYDHEQLAENWAKVDQHDHSPGKGVKISTPGIQDAAITAPKIAEGAITTHLGGAQEVTGSTAATKVTSVIGALEALGLIEDNTT